MSESQTVGEIISTATEQAVPEVKVEETNQPVIETTETTLKEPAAPEESKPADPKEPKENHDVRRMKRLLREKYEAEAERDALRAVIERQSSSQPEYSGEPDREKFQDDQSYIKALVEYKTKEITANLQHEIERKTAINTYQQKVTEAKKDLPDFDDVISESTVQFHPAIRDAIISSPFSPYVAYELAKDIETAERIAQLPPAIAAREIGRLEAKIEVQRTSRTKAAPVQPSKAPAPIKPLSSKGDAAPLDPSRMSDADWWKWERQRMLSKQKK